MPTATFTKTGTKAQTPAKLDPLVFGVKDLNQRLLHQAYDAYLANGRLNLAQTKTRGLVQGGGRKPWRQKGTGRARVGSRRTPLWRGGGIIFGPTGTENYTRKLNQKSKRQAIIQTLSALNARGGIIIIEDIELKAPKTADLSKLLTKIGAKGNTVIIVDSLSEALKLSARNLPSVEPVQAGYLNTVRLMNADSLVISKPALSIMPRRALVVGL